MLRPRSGLDLIPRKPPGGASDNLTDCIGYSGQESFVGFPGAAIAAATNPGPEHSSDLSGVRAL